MYTHILYTHILVCIHTHVICVYVVCIHTLFGVYEQHVYTRINMYIHVLDSGTQVNLTPTERTMVEPGVVSVHLNMQEKGCPMP